jgi:hypothetical protein
MGEQVESLVGRRGGGLEGDADPSPNVGIEIEGITVGGFSSEGQIVGLVSEPEAAGGVYGEAEKVPFLGFSYAQAHLVQQQIA